MPSRVTRRWRAPWLPPPARAALVLATLIGVFLWTPLTGGGYYAAADHLQQYPLHRVAPAGYQPKNGLLSDTVVQALPFLRWNREELGRGRLPLWNPYNGWGAPHLANAQSAVFSPFSLPFYLLDWRPALLVAPALKLFALGFFTYLFLRRLALWHWAALAGAVAFTYGGFHLVWLHLPLVGVSAALPASLYFVERARQAPLERQAARRLALAGLGASLAVGLLAGHPETFFFDALLVGAYGLFRLLQGGEPWLNRARRAGEFIAAGLLALGLAAAQLVPFLEYLGQSQALAIRFGGHETALASGAPPDGHVFHGAPIQFAALLAFPDLLGNPVTASVDPVLNQRTNYNEMTGSYPGLLTLWLAGGAILAWRRHRSGNVAFFAGAALVWFLYMHDIFWIGQALSQLPLVGAALPTRSANIWLFSLAALTAWVIHLARAGRGPSLPALWLWGGLLLGLAGAGAWNLIAWASQQPETLAAAPAARAHDHACALPGQRRGPRRDRRQPARPAPPDARLVPQRHAARWPDRRDDLSADRLAHA